MFGETARPLTLQGAVEGEAEMQDVEHLGKYVYEMTKAKVEVMRASGGVMPSREVEMGGLREEEEDDREENVLISEEVAEDGMEEDEDEE
jgi:intron-binding protein aquarius